MDAIAALARRGRPGRRGGAGRAARVHRLALVPRGVPRLRRLRVLPPAPPGPVRDLAADALRRRADRRARPRLRDRVLRRPAEEAADDDRPPEGESSGWAGWRCATGCSSTGRRTGRPPCAPTRGAIEAASGRKPRLRAADPIPGVRGVARLAEAFAVIPLVKRALPEARLPFQDPGVLAVAAGASLGGTLLRRHVRGAGGEAAAAAISLHAGPVRPARRRAGRVPRRGAQGDRRLRGRRRGRRRRRPRSTTAAARISWRRCWPPTSRARCCCGARSSGRARSPAARSRWPPRPPRSRSSPGASATRRLARRAR